MTNMPVTRVIISRTPRKTVGITADTGLFMN